MGEIGVGAFISAIHTNTKELVVFISSSVFDKQDALVVCPEISPDTAFRFVSELLHFSQISSGINGAYEDVHTILIGSHKGNV